MKKLILIALACSLSAAAFAKKSGETRTATVKTEISGSDIINIRAKDTELIVETWDKNEVEIVATIRFDGEMSNKMENFLAEFEENVKNNISMTGGELEIDANLDIPNKIQIGSKNIGINVSFGDKELKLTYKIKAPKANKYIISSSYQDVRLVGSFDKLDLTQYSGDLEAGIIKSANMNLKYGTASFESINEGEMELYEQKLEINTLGVLELNAKYSNLEFEKVDKLEVVAYESDFEIGMITEMKGNMKYGEVNIAESIENAKFEFYEMSIEAAEAGTIELEDSKYSKFEFGTVSTITFDQSYEDETDIGTVDSFESKNSKYGNHTIDLLKGNLKLYAYEDEIAIDDLGNNATELIIDGKYIDASIGIGTASFNLMTNVKYGKVIYDESTVEVKRYIKDGDQLEIEAKSKTESTNPILISVKGYEVDVKLN
ncbi:MAG: hypothetical protein ABJG47_18345 [Ekhidna sp.]